MEKIRVGIMGYGNLGRGVELAVTNNDDMQLVAIFSRRDDIVTKSGLAVNVDKIMDYKDKIDIMIMCGGSATDLQSQGEEMIKNFNIIDSFDTHAKVGEHFDNLEKIAKENGKLGMISVGWDPGLFSMARMLFGAVLPNGTDYTFWGKGVSQGHSDAVRRIDGVIDARQYTIPVDSAVEQVRAGSNPKLSTREKHTRLCYVVAEEGANCQEIERKIVEMPNYFSDYNTTVKFISMQEMKENHSGIPHGGMVLRSGDTYSKNKHLLEFRLQLDSNPEFTASVLTAFARAVAKLAKDGKTGCMTVFDCPLGLLSPISAKQLREHLL